MQRATQRLTQSIEYIGAGTVEFLYHLRLQVEHPVTEDITGVNFPAT
jgi:acetyl/propionyl-CoA carboxylase alpha subunit